MVNIRSITSWVYSTKQKLFDQKRYYDTAEYPGILYCTIIC